MDFETLEQGAPEAFRRDSLWKMKAYRLALYLGDLYWHDIAVLTKDQRMTSVADQLYRAVGSVSANLAEGYSGVSGKDRALFYQYSLGSTHEARDWYYKARHILGDEILNYRVEVLTEILKLVVKMIPQQRGYLVREDQAPYETD